MRATVQHEPFGVMSDAAARCRSEFLEMPGMRLTLPQAARFLGIDRVACEQALEQLVRCGFLRKNGPVYGLSVNAVRD